MNPRERTVRERGALSAAEQDAWEAIVARLTHVGLPREVAEQAATDLVLWLRATGWRPTAARTAPSWRDSLNRPPAAPDTAAAALASMRATLAHTPQEGSSDG